MTDDILARAKAAMEGVTPGPWKWDGDSFADVRPAVCPHGSRWEDHGPNLIRDGIDRGLTDQSSHMDYSDVITSNGYDASSLWIRTADAEFIAAARSLIPELIDALEAAPERTFTDDLGRHWEWCGGVPGTWAWRITRLPK